MALSENKYKICPIEYNPLFGVDVGVIRKWLFSRKNAGLVSLLGNETQGLDQTSNRCSPFLVARKITEIACQLSRTSMYVAALSLVSG